MKTEPNKNRARAFALWGMFVAIIVVHILIGGVLVEVLIHEQQLEQQEQANP